MSGPTPAPDGAGRSRAVDLQQSIHFRQPGHTPQRKLRLLLGDAFLTSAQARAARPDSCPVIHEQPDMRAQVHLMVPGPKREVVLKQAARVRLVTHVSWAASGDLDCLTLRLGIELRRNHRRHRCLIKQRPETGQRLVVRKRWNHDDARVTESTFPVAVTRDGATSGNCMR
jgi:hypothetical protein